MVAWINDSPPINRNDCDCLVVWRSVTLVHPCASDINALSLRRLMSLHKKTKQIHASISVCRSTNATNELDDNLSNKYYVSVVNIFGAPTNQIHYFHFVDSMALSVKIVLCKDPLVARCSPLNMNKPRFFFYRVYATPVYSFFLHVITLCWLYPTIRAWPKRKAMSLATNMENDETMPPEWMRALW